MSPTEQAAEDRAVYDVSEGERQALAREAGDRDGYQEIGEAAAPQSATEWLADRLAGGEQPATAVTDAAARAGFSRGQMRHARGRLGVVSTQRQRAWWWSLPRVDAGPPPVPHAPAHFRRDFLPATDLEWLEALRERHVALADEWAHAVHARGAVELERRRADAAYGEAVREALRSGDPMPDRPAALVPDVIAGRQVVARESERTAADELSRHVTTSLSTLRRRRGELRPYLTDFGEALSVALGTAIHASTAITAAELRALADELDPPHLADSIEGDEGPQEVAA